MQAFASTFQPVEASLRILVVCKHASALYGGEAILPLHYFRLLRARGIDVWLVTHARTRAELSQIYPNEPRIHYVEDTLFQQVMWRLGTYLPTMLAHITTGFLSQLAAQASQRRIVQDLVRDEGIHVVHQPNPVSPREPSLIFDVGAPVIIGPMNGGMDYPPAFRRRRGRIEALALKLARKSTMLVNTLLPGKRRAALLLVANQRTRRALPDGINPRVQELVENGVELDLWKMPPPAPDVAPPAVTTFAFVGRLIGLKAVDLMLEAFAIASRQQPMRMLIIGDGEEAVRLQNKANELFPPSADDAADDYKVRFTGWLNQIDCAEVMTGVDCLVMPSLRDCGGAVVLEAMSMAKPVIATAWGGPLDYLDDSCGILVEPSDRQSLIDGMARAMVRLAASPAECKAMGLAGRAKVEQHYDWDMKATQILRIYQQVAESGCKCNFADPVVVRS